MGEEVLFGQIGKPLSLSLVAYRVSSLKIVKSVNIIRNRIRYCFFFDNMKEMSDSLKLTILGTLMGLTLFR